MSTIYVVCTYVRFNHSTFSKQTDKLADKLLELSRNGQ